MPTAIAKQITAGLTGATDSLSWHIVIYIIVIYHVWCGSPNILVCVWFARYVSTSQNEGEIALSHRSLWTTTQVLWLSMLASSSCEKLSSLEILLFPPPDLAAVHLCATCF